MASNVSDNPPVYRALAQPGEGSATAYEPETEGEPSKQVVVVQQPSNGDYDYVPSDYMVLSILFSVVCCIFSPLVAAFINLPAYILSSMSRQSNKEGRLARARTQGLVAAYLNVCAVVTALVIALVLTPLVITLSPRRYWTHV